MLWVAVDVLLGLLALGLLGLVAFRLYKRVRVLTARVGDTSRTLSDLSAGLQVRQPPSAHPTEVP